ncbi:MAG TPA: DUF5655 domain-containing protein [Thermoplasmata archaeon]|nr:DUF5655 domain-containing protein [Thermoplasmata archaeon]
MREQIRRQLVRQTGADLPEWNARIRASGPDNPEGLRAWLTKRGVTGYPRMLLGYERFGYPEFMLASAKQLIDGQYEGKPVAHALYEAAIRKVSALGKVEVQARKTYVSLLGPRRTFARLQVVGRDTVAMALRLDAPPGGRLDPSKVHDSMPVQITLRAPRDLDAEALRWVRQALDEAS